MKHLYAHVDADSFFVSCERTLHPELNGIPVAVGGRGDRHIFQHEPESGKQLHLSNQGHFSPTVFSKEVLDISTRQIDAHFIEGERIRGIVIAASYEAKRGFGVKVGMTLLEALQICPRLVVLPTNHLLYHRISQTIQNYLTAHCALVEAYSVDEMFLDFHGMLESLEELQTEALRIQEDIKERYGIPVSIGLSDRSKWCAKFISDCAKPYGVRSIPSEEWLDYIADKPVGDFPGIGRAFGKKLKSLGIKTLGECVKKPHLFEQWWRVGGRDLYKRIMGQDNEPVHPSHARKGVGISRSFDPVSDRTELKRRIAVLCRHLSHTIQTLEVNPTTFHFSLQYEIRVYRNHKSVTESRIFNEKFFTELAWRVVLEELDIYKSMAVIYLSISTSNFLEHKHKTTNLLTHDEDSKQRDLDKAIRRLRDRHGMDIVRNGLEG